MIATRGARLALDRVRYSGRDRRPDAFHLDALDVVEINAEERATARVLFDSDDFNAAFAELDARYLAGEAANYPHTWSVLTQANEALNQRETPRDDVGLRAHSIIGSSQRSRWVI